MNTIKVGQSWRKLFLICVKSKPIHKPNFKSISQKTAEKNKESNMLVKGNSSSKSRLIKRDKTWT